jgi:3-hydroxyisobutyrate dehydrogenase-like beta-hydroxyacid dehydrogenase
MPRKSRKNVGLIGLGIIGSRVANALRSEGFHVYVWNRTPRAAPNFLASPRQVAELCDVIQIFVADAQALFDVLDSMGEVLTPSHVILCNSTVGPEATLEAARIVQERGAQFLDAPFTGSKAAAESRELVYYIGGSDKTLQAAEPVLKASSKAIVKIGKIGDAAVVKVATNLISAVTVQTLAEAYAIVKGSGIDPMALSEALKHHAVRSAITDSKLIKILDRQYEPHFSLKHMFKDVQLGIHIANSLDIDLPATTSTAGVMYGGLTRGWADDDFSVLARSYQKEDQPQQPLAVMGPSSPTPPPPPPPKETPALPPIGAEKKAPPRESTTEELRNVGIIIPEPPPPIAEAPAPVAPKTEAPMPAAPAAVVTPDKSKEPELPAQQPIQPVAPADPTPAHTPFVRIRRWFGTGSAN